MAQIARIVLSQIFIEKAESQAWASACLPRCCSCQPPTFLIDVVAGSALLFSSVLTRQQRSLGMAPRPRVRLHRCARPGTCVSFRCSGKLHFAFFHSRWSVHGGPYCMSHPTCHAGACSFASFCRFARTWVCMPFRLWFRVRIYKTLPLKYFPGWNNAQERPCTHVYPWGPLDLVFIFLSTHAFVTHALCLFCLHWFIRDHFICLSTKFWQLSVRVW